MFVKIQSVVIT